MRDMRDEKISVAEAASLLFVTPATVRNWIRSGILSSDGSTVSRAEIEKTVGAIRNGSLDKLTARRNKSAMRGCDLYEDYLEDDGTNRAVCGAILETFRAEGAEAGRIPDILRDQYALLRKRRQTEGSPSFVPYQDYLGFVYLSLKANSDRKTSGLYYTPQRTVAKMMDEMERVTPGIREKRMIDPCCGTGNFLLEALRRGIPFENLYGMDIDEDAVKIARMNLRLNGIRDERLLAEHIRCGDYLRDAVPGTFDLIVGNPPWGYVYSEEEKAAFLGEYQCASRHGTESYDLFLERSIRLAGPDTRIGFVLPEAILNVGRHRTIREILRQKTGLRFVCYIGNAFRGVSCPVILLGAERREMEENGDIGEAGLGCRITCGTQTRILRLPRDLTDHYWNFDVTDEEERVLRKIRPESERVYLKGNADFALGIVTGSNREFLSEECVPGSEMVLRGSDIERYTYRDSGVYLRYDRARLQQAAREEFYRAEEKLIYRFIGTTPAFAYDDRGLLTLNSANILIPRMEGYSIRYILAVLNSPVVSFWCRKKYRSVKLLRSHIEEIPIPEASEEEQREIVKLVDEILRRKKEEDTNGILSVIEQKIGRLYGLTESELEMCRR